MATANQKHTLKLVVRETDLECSICHHDFKEGTLGSAIEAGRNRRFCPDCFEDILRDSGIRKDEFLD